MQPAPRRTRIKRLPPASVTTRQVPTALPKAEIRSQINQLADRGRARHLAFPPGSTYGTRKSDRVMLGGPGDRFGGDTMTIMDKTRDMLRATGDVLAQALSLNGKATELFSSGDLTFADDADAIMVAGSPGRRRSPGRRVAGSPGRRVAGSPGRRVAGSPGRRVAGSPGRRVAGSPGRRVAGSPNLRPWLGR